MVDDHPIMREGLVALLSDDDDIDVVGSAATAAEALEQVAAHPPHVVLMDYRLPDQDGASAATAIRRNHPEVAVVFLSADSGERALFAAVEAGAVGFMVKSEAASAVSDAVRRAARGEVLLSPALLTQLIQRQRQLARDQRQRERLLGELTARELEVLRLMAEGLDNQEIADRLRISYMTVRGHVRNVLAKVGAHNKLAAVARAIEHGLVAPREG